MHVYWDTKHRRFRHISTLTGAMLLSLPLISLPVVAADKNKSEASSIDDLFGGPVPAKKPAKTAPPAAPLTSPESTAAPQPIANPVTPAAIATDKPLQEEGPANAVLARQPQQSISTQPTVTGFFQNDLAYTYAGEKHWSRFNNTLDLSTKGRTAGGVAWKLGGRLNYEPIYDLTDYYPKAVRNDQRFEATIREAYADFSAGSLDFRLGRQHIVWGEMTGLFFADVVSAKDLRQSVLPDFDMIRIPQWAARAEYFSGDFHAEGVWIPSMSYDDIGKPGAEFYPFKPPAITGFQTIIAKEKKPTGLNDAGYGARLSWLKDGWDVSSFYYTANDASASFSRQISSGIITYQPDHKRIHQLGATLGKDLGPMVLKAEAVYTRDKLFNTLDPIDADGLVKQNTLDYIVGLEWSFPQETRFNAQIFQRWFTNHNASIVPDKFESGISLLLSTQALHPRIEPELLLISSLNRADWLAQFKLTWKMDGNWRLATGVDIFQGHNNGLFGTYDKNDRVYTEARYSF